MNGFLLLPSFQQVDDRSQLMRFPVSRQPKSKVLAICPADILGLAIEQGRCPCIIGSCRQFTPFQKQRKLTVPQRLGHLESPLYIKNFGRVLGGIEQSLRRSQDHHLSEKVRGGAAHEQDKRFGLCDGNGQHRAMLTRQNLCLRDHAGYQAPNPYQQFAGFGADVERVLSLSGDCARLLSWHARVAIPRRPERWIYENASAVVADEEHGSAALRTIRLDALAVRAANDTTVTIPATTATERMQRDCPSINRDELDRHSAIPASCQISFLSNA